MREKVIAVLGVSADPAKFGHQVFKALLERGFQVHGVNPKGGEVLGRTLATALAAVAPRPDLVVTVVPPAATEQAVEECHRLGIPELWMQPGSESAAALDRAKALGLAVTHHACMLTTVDLW